MNRRSFFNKLLQAAAIIGLAPRLAFRAPELDFKLPAKWELLPYQERILRWAALDQKCSGRHTDQNYRVMLQNLSDTWA